LTIACIVAGSAAGDTPGLPASAGSAADTDYTPQSQDGKLGGWSQVAGVPFGETSPINPITDASVDFYGVRFLNPTNGFAVGAGCAKAATSFSDLPSCRRVPVIYRYTAPPGQPGQWREDYRGGTPGYVATVQWLGPGRALAVGGDGCYPRREESCPSGAGPSASDPAGRARAWLYEGGRWRELTDLPATMAGLTALGLSSRAADCGSALRDCGFAGGLAQLWMYQDGRFLPTPYTSTSAGDRVVQASDWLFRVRDLRFVPGANPAVKAVAITAGCCSSDPTRNTARVLVFDGQRWFVKLLYDKHGGTAGAQTLPDSYYSLVLSRVPELVMSVVASPGGPAGVGDSSRIVGDVELPDAVASSSTAPILNYGFSPTANAFVEVLFGQGSGKSTDLVHELANPAAADLRLNAGDGDLTGPPPNYAQGGAGVAVAAHPPGPDGVIDWAVGSFISTGQAAAYTTTRTADGFHGPNPLNCGDGTPGAQCRPDPTVDTKSHSLFMLPTYALNAYAAVGDTGGGWAVGDRGGIVRLGAQGRIDSSAGEPSSPNLGKREPASLPSQSPYDAYRPLPAAEPAGGVPALVSQPFRPDGLPGLVAFGSPEPNRPVDERREDVASVVSSRDGSEAWALGASSPSDAVPSQLSLFRFSGDHWRRCETGAGPSQLVSDPSCSGLAPVQRADETANIVAAVRIPVENGSDPSRADEFQAIAIGSKYSLGTNGKHPLVLRYGGGRWGVDDVGMGQIDAPGVNLDRLSSVAFTAPDDGWVTGYAAGMVVFHYDGRQWINCKASPSHCADPSGRLPFSDGKPNSEFHLLSVGRRTYLYGSRTASTSAGAVTDPTGGTKSFPVILWRDGGQPCTKAGDAGCWHADGGGYDPKLDSGQDPQQQGALHSLSVVRNLDASYSGWGVGTFGSSGQAILIHLTQADGGASPTWKPWQGGDATDDYLTATEANGHDSYQQVTLPGAHGDGAAFLVARDVSGAALPVAPLLAFDPVRARWRVQPTPFSLSYNSHANQGQRAVVQAMAPDGRGGYWLTARQESSYGPSDAGVGYAQGAYFYDFTSRIHRPVFTDVPHPVREPVTASARSPEGGLWVATASGALYRYDRLTGWDRVVIHGWDPGDIVTSPSPAYAIAVGASGRGLAVGRSGRIADLSPAGAVLDAAAGLRCSPQAVPGPCGTTRNLRTAAIAPDESAIVAGDGRAVLWRPAGGQFRPVAAPETAPSASFTGASMPSADRAWLTTDSGQIFAGRRSGSDWAWQLENVDANGDVLDLGPGDRRLGLHGISLTSDGQGYAVGDHGLILRRTGDGERPWQRVSTGFLDDLYSVSVGAGPSHPVLIGGGYGLILSGANGAFAVAHAADAYDPLNNSDPNHASRVVGVSLIPGYRSGELEAWAIEQNPSEGRTPAPTSVLHFATPGSDPLLTPTSRAQPLPDTPGAKPGEIRIGAFGKSDCHLGVGSVCPEPTGSNLFQDLVSARVADALIDRSRDATPLSAAVFTGDVNDAAGRGTAQQAPAVGGATPHLDTPADPSFVHHRWVELIANRFADAALPVYGALGGQDLSQPQACALAAPCAGHGTRGGTNLAWRQALGVMPAPWGAPGAPPPPHP